MRRHSTHLDWNSTTSSRHSIAWNNASIRKQHEKTSQRMETHWMFGWYKMIEMYHDVSYGQWYLWMCTTHIQPPHVQYVEWNDACIIHTHPNLFEIFVKTTERNYTTPNLPSLLTQAVWTCMDNLILCFFFSLKFFALLDWTTPPNRNRPIGR